MELNNITIGADPELFFIDKQGKFISAIGLIPGTKDNPSPVTALGDGFAIQQDNVACEFNIPACSNTFDFAEANVAMLEYIYNEYAKPNGLALSNAASAIFEPDQLNNPMASVFGCDPDLNAYTYQENDAPRSKIKGLRSAGGHIHIGYDTPNAQNSFEVVRWLDFIIGLPLLLLDTDARRRKLYGKAGACRIKNYGVEYRTPSNYWLFDPDVMVTLPGRVRNVAACRDSILKTETFQPHMLELAQHVINTNNKTMAKKLVKMFDLSLV